MADEEEKKLRVVDRRMFTAEGDLRPDFQPEEPAAAPPPPKPAPPPPPRNAAAAPPPPDAERAAERPETEP
ncbi:MAG: DUF1844 domain-containing protein, partial [Thermoanaerobaculia bacterium]